MSWRREKQPLRCSQRKSTVENSARSKSARAIDHVELPTVDCGGPQIRGLIHFMHEITRKKKSRKRAQPEDATEETPKKKRRTKADTITEKLRSIGDKPNSSRGNCARAAIYKGSIKMKWDPSDLDQVIMSGELQCGHKVDATLRDLLIQPDYAGLDYEDGLESATVFCKVEDCCCDPGEDRTYVSGICTGKPSFDCGKSHNHCNECKNFGQCIWDYRELHCDDCGKHYFGGFYDSYECECKETEEDKIRKSVLGFAEMLGLEEELLETEYWKAGLDSESQDESF